MKNLEQEHDKVIHHLKNIKSAIIEMRQEGLGGDDFEFLYLTNRLIPTITKIFTSKHVDSSIIVTQTHIHTKEIREMVLDQNLVEDIAAFNGKLSRALVHKYLTEGKAVYTNFHKYEVRA